MTSQTHPQEVAELVERLRLQLAEQAWAATWEHDIVPSGKPAHKLACDAIRALPTLLAALTKAAPPVEGDLREALEAARAYIGCADMRDDEANAAILKIDAALASGETSPEKEKE